MEEDLLGLLTTAAATWGFGHLVPDVPINWVRHPQGLPLPAVVLNRISGDEGYTMGGPDGLVQARVQVDVYALDHAQAVRLARDVRAVLVGHRGQVTLGFFEGVFLTSTRSGDVGGSNEAERPFRQSMDLDVNWRAT